MKVLYTSDGKEITMKDHNDLEVIINNQTLIMGVLHEHLKMVGNREECVEILKQRISDMQKRSIERWSE